MAEPVHGTALAGAARLARWRQGALPDWGRGNLDSCDEVHGRGRDALNLVGPQVISRTLSASGHPQVPTPHCPMPIIRSMKKLLPLLAIAVGAMATAQSPLTTLFAQNNGGGAGWTMYFDVTVNIPLTFTQFDINNNAGAVAGSISVYYTTSATTYVGNDTNAGAWTLGGTGTCTGAATNVPTPCPISPF